jgi:hypothetical protein
LSSEWRLASFLTGVGLRPVLATPTHTPGLATSFQFGEPSCSWFGYNVGPRGRAALPSHGFAATLDGGKAAFVQYWRKWLALIR